MGSPHSSGNPRKSPRGKEEPKIKKHDSIKSSDFWLRSSKICDDKDLDELILQAVAEHDLEMARKEQVRQLKRSGSSFSDGDLPRAESSPDLRNPRDTVVRSNSEPPQCAATRDKMRHPSLKKRLRERQRNHGSKQCCAIVIVLSVVAIILLFSCIKPKFCKDSKPINRSDPVNKPQPNQPKKPQQNSHRRMFGCDSCLVLKLGVGMSGALSCDAK